MPAGNMMPPFNFSMIHPPIGGFDGRFSGNFAAIPPPNQPFFSSQMPVMPPNGQGGPPMIRPNSLGSTNIGSGNLGSGNLGAGNLQTGNIQPGNLGTGNLGTGNMG